MTVNAPAYTINELATMYAALRLWQRMPHTARNVRNRDEDPHVHERVSGYLTLADNSINELCTSLLNDLIAAVVSRRP
jgi:hypothetical protein